MNLLWAHLGQPTKSVLLPKMSRVYCDFAHISDPSKKPAATQESLPEVTGTEAVLGLDVEVKGFTRAHLLPPGIYRMSLKLAASNHAPRDYTVEIDFPGKWFDDESKMFSDGFGMRLL
jgi:hypothetical protein